MKSYLFYSCAAHGLLVAALIVVGTLLSKPRMSYYAIDLMSAPAGGGSEPGPVVSPVSTPAPPAPKVVIPKVTAPKVARPAPREAAEEELPDQDTIRMLAKLKKKRLTQQKKSAGFMRRRRSRMKVPRVPRNLRRARGDTERAE